MSDVKSNTITPKFRGVHPQTGEVMDVCCIDWMHDEVWFERATDATYTIEQCQLMQFTGLTDSNGELAHSGHIIGFGDDAPDSRFGMFGCLGVIEYIASETAFMVRLTDGRVVRLTQWLSSDCKCGFTIYGNIHENKELLNNV